MADDLKCAIIKKFVGNAPTQIFITMAKIEVSLTRAHKIAERLKQAASALFDESKALAQPVALQGVVGDAQVQRLKAQGERVMALATRAQAYTRAAASVRSTIGMENASRGISNLMAELDATNRILAVQKDLLTASKSMAVQASDLLETQAQSNDASRVGYYVSVRVLTESDRQALELEVAALQREAYSLSDRIAEANAARVTLELADEMVKEVTST